MIRNLVTYLSNHLCQALITAGFIAGTLTITGASNASPIVVTTAAPHLLLPNAVVFVQGVVGNTAANDFWVITPIDNTHFSLNGSVGNGNYVSGGTAQSALIGGKILFGRRWVQQNQMAPRIVMIPVEGDPGMPRDQYDMTDASTLSPNQLEALLAPGVAVARHAFEVQCWGAASPPDPDFDFDATEILRDQVIRSADALFRGNYTTQKGPWVDQQEKATTEMKIGHLFKFYLTLDAPVPQTPNQFAPPTPGFEADVYGLNQGPSAELAATIIK